MSVRWATSCSATFAALACAVVVAGCMSLQKLPAKRLELPSKHSVVLDQLVIHSNFELPSQHRLLQEINAQRVDLSNKLNLPISDETIQVYLFQDGEQYRSFIRQKFPSFPDRRAFFVETDTRLTVFAHWGDRVAEDLRHEVAHGYLHAVLLNIPLWLDEGLAEYFETPRGTHGVNASHVTDLNALLKEGKWRPDLRRLESLRSPEEMSQLDYAESWAWMHWFLETTPQRKAMLHEYLADLRRTAVPTPLSLYLRRLPGEHERSLAEYVASLGNKK